MSSSAMHLASMLSPLNLMNAHASAAQQRAQATTTPSATGSTTTPSTTSGDSGLDGTTTGQTFLNLLVKELQNQDPDSPMDSTAMVGQMISLNQLDQLISINQTLSTASTAASTKSPTAHAVSADPDMTSSGMSSSAQIAERTALQNIIQNATALQAAQPPATDPSQILDLSNLNTPFGGK